MKVFFFIAFLPIFTLAQTASDSNEVLRKEYFEYKKEVEQLYEQASQYDSRLRSYKREIDSLSKTLKLNYLQFEREKLMRYRDTIECDKKLLIRSIVPFDEVLLQDCEEIPRQEIDFFYYLRPSLKLYNLVLDSLPNQNDNRKLNEAIMVAKDRIAHNRWLLENFPDIERRYLSFKQRLPEFSLSIAENTHRIKLINQQLADTLFIWRETCQLKPEHCKICEDYKQQTSSLNDDIYIGPIDESAYFQGNIKQYIASNLVYPERAIREKIEGKCYLQFMVDSLGNVINVRVKKGVADCPECDREALIMVENMPPWEPGRVGGIPKVTTYNLPISFKLP